MAASFGEVFRQSDEQHRETPFSSATLWDRANFLSAIVVLTSSNVATLRFVRLGGQEIGYRQRVLT